MNPELSKDLPFIRKRAAQLFSKSRFIAGQFDAYLHDELWLIWRVMPMLWLSACEMASLALTMRD